MKRNKLYIAIHLIAAMFMTTDAIAQATTYNHDATKMNQFTMQEIGTGSFQSDSEHLLYDIFHPGYKKTITSTNKQMYRTTTYEGSYMQVGYADSIKTRLESRAKSEAVNVADRQLDVAWLTEQTKIENALTIYKNNLSRLSAYGADAEERDDWGYYANMYDFAISRIKDAYLANSERQKEYLNIYNDITKRNSQLVGRMRYLKSLRASKDLLASSRTHTNRKTEIVTASYNNWRDNIASSVGR